MAVFEALSAQAAACGRLRHAIGYMRLAEFFTPPNCSLCAVHVRGRLCDLAPRVVAGFAILIP